MNLAELKNIDLGALFKSLVANRQAMIKGPHGKMVLWCVLGGALFVGYIAFVFWPAVERRHEMEQKVAQTGEMEAKLNYMNIAVARAQEELTASEKNYAALNHLFSVETELEELYQRLSNMATAQGLVISSLTKEGEEAVLPPPPPGSVPAGGAPQNPAQTAATGTQAAPASPLFYRIKLKIEVAGQYNRYMRFRKQLAEFEKIVNIDKEEITLVPGDTQGRVTVKAQMSTFRLPNKLNVRGITPPAADKTSRHDQPLRAVLAYAEFAIQPVAGIEVALHTFSDIEESSSVVQSTNSEYRRVAANDESLGAVAGNPRASRSVERDPFARSSSGMIEGGRDPRTSPLLMASPESYVITGVIVSPAVKAAMIRTDFRENFVVRVGDHLGNRGGIISDIDMDGIVLKQGDAKLRLYVQTQSSLQYGNTAGGSAR